MSFTNRYDMASEFAGMLVCHMDKPAWPGLDDPVEKKRMVALAKKHGFYDYLAKEAKATEPVTVPFRFRDIKGKLPYPYYWGQIHRLCCATLAASMEHPDVGIELVEDIYWSFCECSTRIDEKSWTDMGDDGRGPCGIQLRDSKLALNMAEGIYLLRERLDPRVTERVTAEITERSLRAGTDWRKFNWWHWGRNNQNTVNVGNLIGAGLYLIKDVYQLASFLMPLINNLSYTLEGFTEDGGCTEGISYWDYGFNHFIMAAIMLKHRTGGMFNLMTLNPKIERICRYPLSVYFEDKVRACWADSFYGHISLRIALMINEFFDIPELYSCCNPSLNKLGDDGYFDLRTLSLYKGQKFRSMVFPDVLLPDLGTAKVHVGTGAKRIGVAVQGGNNGVHHNHNDIGSFLFYKNGVPVFTDPGYPDYYAFPGNFGKERYDCVYNNTFGHSAPIINGQPQPAGAEYRGHISVDNLGGRGDKTVHLDLTEAYAVPTLKKLRRAYCITEKGELHLTDSYVFSAKPKAVYEQFITYERAKASGKGVLIASGKKRFHLESSAPGRFTVERLEEESKYGRGQGVITRIRFYPDVLEKDMTLAFRAW